LGLEWALAALSAAWGFSAWARRGSGDLLGKTAEPIMVAAALVAASRTQAHPALAAPLFVSGWLAARSFLTMGRLRAGSSWIVLVVVGACVAGLIAEGQGAWTFAGLLPLVLVAACMRAQARAEGEVRGTLGSLSAMLQRAHPNTSEHLERVAQLAERTALELGLPSERAKLVREAARLHDIGKIAVDERVLDKPGSLTPEEYRHVQLHARYGGEILEQVSELRAVAEWVHRHHERPDGKGYPDGLCGTQIPVEAQIIAVADAFDAMTGGLHGGQRRPYREPMAPASALAEVERCAGTQFDPRVVRAFRAAYERGEEI
jgi:putative nucleotidyltransferase with HDIG domain